MSSHSLSSFPLSEHAAHTFAAPFTSASFFVCAYSFSGMPASFAAAFAASLHDFKSDPSQASAGSISKFVLARFNIFLYLQLHQVCLSCPLARLGMHLFLICRHQLLSCKHQTHFLKLQHLLLFQPSRAF